MKAGIAYVSKSRSKTETAADYVGSGNVCVYSTPSMIALMENAAFNCAAASLENGETTVGISVEIRHISATPIGMNVSAKAVLTDIRGKILTFSVFANDDAGLIGEGIMKRAIVKHGEFMERANKKLSLSVD